MATDHRRKCRHGDKKESEKVLAERAARKILLVKALTAVVAEKVFFLTRHF